MFYSTDISVTLWILNNNKKGGPRHGRILRNREGEILFVDLRTWNDNVYEKRFVKLSKEQIADVCKIYYDWQTTNSDSYAKPELYYSAHIDEIRKKGYSLVPNRYVEFIDKEYVLNEQELIKAKDTINNSLIPHAKDLISDIVQSIEIVGTISLNKYPLRELASYIEIVDNRNGMRYGEDRLRGVTSESLFDTSKAKTQGIDFAKYKIVNKGEFAYNPSRINLGSIALCEEVCIISPMYIVFKIKDEKIQELLPDFLMLWFARKEFKRSTLFYASGSVRDTFSFDEMCRVKMPIPSIETQQKIVDISKHSECLKETIMEINEMASQISTSLIQKLI